MRKIAQLMILAGVMAAPVVVLAADAAPAAPASPHTFTGNVSFVNNYIFRGQTQTWNEPAIQAGLDYSHADGWYAGAWGSTISDKQFAGAAAEMDFYGGYNGKFNSDFGWTVGGLLYHYEGGNYNKAIPVVGNQNYENFEINAGVSYKFISAKLSVALTDYFGMNQKTGFVGGTKGTTYFDLTANVPLRDDITLALHYGKTSIKSNYNGAPTIFANGKTDPSYNDWKIGLTKTFEGGFNIGAAYTYADNKDYYRSTASAVDNGGQAAQLNGGHVVLSLGYTF